MNVHLKRTLILCLMLLCLFGLTVLGASAAENTGYANDQEALAADSSFVARIGEGTSATYYTTLNDAINAISAEGQTIYMIADFTQSNSIGGYDKKPTHAAAAKYSFTLTSIDPENITLTVGAGQFFDLGDGSKVVPTLKNIKINVQGNMLGWFNNVSVVIDEGTHIYGAGNGTYGIIYGVGAANITIKSGATVDITSANYIVVAAGNTQLNIEGGTFTKNSHGMNLMHLNGAGVEMTISGGHFSIGYTSSTAELFRISQAKYVTLSGGTFENKGTGTFVYYTTAGKTGTLKVTDTFALPSVAVVFHSVVTFADDATAVNLGYVARVGELGENGTPSSNYYKTLNEAISAITTSGTTVYLITDYTQPSSLPKNNSITAYTLSSSNGAVLTAGASWLFDLGDGSKVVPTVKNIEINLGSKNLGYFNNVSVIIDDGAYIHGTGNSSGLIYGYKNANITVKAGATIEATGGNAIFYVQNGTMLTVEGGTFKHTGSNHIVYIVAGAGDTTISGGEFTHGGSGRIIQNSGATLNITNGTFTHNGSGMLLCANSAASTNNISGGTFTHNGSEDLIVVNNASVVVNISGTAQLTSNTETGTHYLFKRYTGALNVTGANVKLLAKGDDILFSNGYDDSSDQGVTVADAYLSTERADGLICDNEAQYLILKNIQTADDAMAAKITGYKARGSKDSFNLLPFRAGETAGKGYYYKWSDAMATVKAGTNYIYIIADATVNGTFTPTGTAKDSHIIIIEGLEKADGTYPVLTEAIDGFVMNIKTGANVTFKNINIVTNGNTFQIDAGSTATTLVLGENTTLTATGALTHNYLFLIYNNAYFTIDATATINVTNASYTTQYEMIRLESSFCGVTDIYGTINFGVTSSANNKVLRSYATNANGKVNIYDGAVINYTSATASIEGAILYTYDAYTVFNIYGGTLNHSSVQGAIIFSNKSTINISGGTFKRTNGTANDHSFSLSGTAALNISGGTFNHNGKGHIVSASTAVTISGGTFSHSGSGNILSGTPAVTGGTFTHTGTGSILVYTGAATVSGTVTMTHEGSGAAFILYRSGGSLEVNGTNVRLIAKGNNYILRQGYDSSSDGGVNITGAYISSESGNICYCEFAYAFLNNIQLDSDTVAANLKAYTSGSSDPGKNPVAALPIRVGDTEGKGYYNKFNVAMSSAANNSTIYVVADFTSSVENSTGAKTLNVTGVKLSNGNYPTITHTSSALFNVQGGGNLTVTNLNVISTTGNVFYVTGTATLGENLVITHSASGHIIANLGSTTIAGATITNNSTGDSRVVAMNPGSSLTVTSGTITNASDYLICQNNANTTVTISGGTFSSSAGVILRMTGANTSATISGGTFTHTGTSPIIDNYSDHTLTITGGTFTNNGTHNLANLRGNVKISGGTFINNGNMIAELSGSVTISGTASFTQNSTKAGLYPWAGNITINGGSFTSTSSGAIVEVRGGNFTITNGAFSNTSTGPVIYIASASTTNISGGTFEKTAASGNLIHIWSTDADVTINGGDFQIKYAASTSEVIKINSLKTLTINKGNFYHAGKGYTGMIYYAGDISATGVTTIAADAYDLPNVVRVVGNAAKIADETTALMLGFKVRIGALSTTPTTADYKANIRDAFSAAASGSTIYVIADYTANSEGSTGAKTLYLEGVKKADGTYVTITHTASCLLNVQGGGNLTVKNLNINSTSGNTCYTTGTLTLGENVVLTVNTAHVAYGTTSGKLYINGATITHGGTGHMFNNSGYIKITAGTITNNSTGDARLVQMNAGSTLEITGGTFTSSSDYLICQNNTSTTVTISGGTFTNKGGSLFHISYGTANISGGEFTTTGVRIFNQEANHTLNISGGTFTNSGSSYLASLRGVANISGGTFINNNNYDLAELSGTTTISGTASFTQNGNNRIFNAWGGTTTISGGTFTASNSANMLVNSATLSISGGTFSHSGSGNILSGTPTVTGGTFTHTGTGSILVYTGAATVSGTVTMTHEGPGAAYILNRSGSGSLEVDGTNVRLIAKGNNYILRQGYDNSADAGVNITGAYISSESGNICYCEFAYAFLNNIQLDSDTVAANLKAYTSGSNDPGKNPVAALPIRVGDTAGKGYYSGSAWNNAISAATSNVYVLASFSTNKAATIPAGASIVIRGLKIGSATTFPTITDTASGSYLIWVNANSSATLYDINVITNGKIVTVDGSKATFTAGNGTTIIGQSVATDTMIQTWGASIVEIAEGASFIVESQSSAMTLFAIYTNPSFSGKIEIAGTMEFKDFNAATGSLFPIYITHTNSDAQVSQVIVSGSIINAAKGGTVAGVGVGQGHCNVTVTGSITLNSTASSQSAVIYLGNGSWHGTLTVSGALTNNDTGAGQSSVLFYNQSTKNATNSIIYINGGARLTLNAINSGHITVFRVNCNVDADATRGDATKGIIITTKGNSKTNVFNCPTLNPDYLTFKNVAFNIQAGNVSSATTTLTNCAFTSDAKAITYKTAIVNMNAETIVLDGITFKTGYYDTLAYAVSCLPEGGSATIYVLANHTAAPFNLANRNVTITSGNGSIFTVTTGTGAGNFINLNGNAKLTLENVTLNISRYGFRFSNGTNNHVVLNSGATMTLGNTEGTWIIRADTANSSITVNDGALLEVTSTTQAANIIYTTVAGVTTTINGGTFKNASTGHILRLENSAVTEVKGGTFKHTGTGYVVYVNSANIAVSGNTVMKHEGAGTSYLYYRQGGNCTVTFVGNGIQLITKGNNYIFEQGYSTATAFTCNGYTGYGVYVEGAYLSTERADGAICAVEQSYMTVVNVKMDSDYAAGLAKLSYRVDNRTAKIVVDGVEKTVYSSYCSSIKNALANVANGATLYIVGDITMDSATSINSNVNIVGIKLPNGQYPTITHSKRVNLIDVNKGANVTFKNVNFLINGEAANLFRVLGNLTMINTNINVDANTNNVFRVSDADAVLTIEGNSKIVNKGTNGLIYQPVGSVVINGGRFENILNAPMIQTESGNITVTQGYFLHEGKAGSAYILYLTGSKDINVSITGKDVIFNTKLSPFNSGNAAATVTVEDASFITLAPLFTNNTYKSRSLINLTLKDDATAALNGAIVRVGDGKLSTGGYTHNYTYGYFTDLAAAVAAAKSGETIYFIVDATITPTEIVISNKDLTFAGGSDGITLTIADTSKWAFNIKNGSDITVTNLTIFANGRVFYMGGASDASNPSTLVIAEDATIYGTTANAQQMIYLEGQYVNVTINGKVGFGKNDGTTEDSQCASNTYLIHSSAAWEGTINVNGEIWSLVTKKSADWHTIFRLQGTNGKLYINEGAKITQYLASNAGYATVNGVIWNDGITVINGATIETNAGLLYIEPNSGKTPVVKVSNSNITVGTKTNTSSTTALSYADDATAALFGVIFRVGDETTDVHGYTCYTAYFTDLAAAVASVSAETPTTIYMMNDYSTSATIVITGNYDITIKSLGDTRFTITETGSWLFNIQKGTKLTLADLNVKSNNSFVRIDAGAINTYLILDGKMDISMTGAINSGDFIDAWNAANLTIGEGVTVTTKGAVATAQVHLVHAQSSFKGQIDIYGKLTNSIGGAFNHKVVRSSSTVGGTINVHSTAVLTNDCAAPANSTEASVLYNYATACPTKFNVYGKLVNTAPYGSIVYLCNGASLNVYTGAELVRNGGVANNFGIFTYGGASVTVYGGSFTNLGKGDILYVNAGTANIFDGYFEACDGNTITVTSSGTLNVYGGTFNYVGENGTVFSNSGNLNVYGGAFRSASTTAPIFTGLAGTTKLDAYVANGSGSLINNAGEGASTANHSNKLGQSFKNVITATAGAAPVIKDGQLVLRFKATVDKSSYAYLSGLAGSNGITFGMLVIPTADLEADYLFTHNSLAEGTYLDIVATEDNITVEDDGCVTIRLELAEFDSATKYSVVFYAKYQPLHGIDVYTYSNYTAGNNARSAEQIARMALNDTSSVPSASKYPYEVMTGVYSPYTVEEYQLLQTYCTNATLPTLDIYIVAGGSAAAGNTPFNSILVKDYPVGNSNIFYSGVVSALDYNSNKYVSAGNSVAYGQGASATTYGPEIGLANALSAYYNAETGKYAAIIKYAADDLSINSTYNYYDYLMQTVQRDLEQYTDMGYAVNVVGMYWQQGEADYTDSYTVSAYKDRFAALVADVRADLTRIVKTVTGNALVNLQEMPVVVGELGISYNAADKSAALSFVEMQQGLVSIDNVALINSSVFTCVDEVFTDIEDMLLAGEMVIANLLNMGNSSLNLGDVVVEVPVAEPLVEVDGVAMRSVLAALANAPAGSTVKLLKDVVLYDAFVMNGLDFTLDGNGYSIISKSEGATLTINNSLVTMKDVVITNESDSDNAYAIELGANAHLTVSGATVVTAYSTAIKLGADNSSITIEGGYFATRAGSADNAIIDTSAANVRIDGGSFVAGGDAACVRINVSAPEKLVVNVTGGSFVADGYAFVNDSYYAIMVISPDADVTGGIYNIGFGNETAA